MSYSSQIDRLLFEIKDLRRRLSALEGINQSKVLTFSDGVNNRILIDGVNGVLKISRAGYNVLTATPAQMLFDTQSLTLAMENLAYTIHPGPRQWTESASYVTINSTEFLIDGDKLGWMKVYFEVLGCVEIAGRTGYYRIYNITDGVLLASSEVSTTAVSSEAEGWINAKIMRSTVLTFPAGEKKYRLQFHQNVTGAAGDTTQFFKGQLIFRPT